MTVIAIDGPAGAGKSSVARAVADELGFAYVDTGAMYRQMAVALEERGVDLADQAAVEIAAPALAARLRVDGGEDPEGRLRDPRVGTAASVVARYPGVRRALAARQRDIARREDVVMEGRDIGTVIAPQAEVKIYLTAERPVRAQRRLEQLGVFPDGPSLQSIEQELGARDHADSVRPDSPLRAAPDAVHIDSTSCDLPTVVADVLRVVGKRLDPR